MVFVEFFAGTQKMTETFEFHKVQAYSLDFVQLKKTRKLNLCMDFLDFETSLINHDHINIMFFGLPCTTFSKASGGKHFNQFREPKTTQAHKSIELINKMFEIIKENPNAIYYIENPSGGILNYKFFLDKVKEHEAHIYNLSMLSFGFPTQKKTIIVTNSKHLLISPLTYRCNGRYQKIKFDNLSLKKRQAYTPSFCEHIYNNAILNFNQ